MKDEEIKKLKGEIENLKDIDYPNYWYEVDKESINKIKQDNCNCNHSDWFEFLWDTISLERTRRSILEGKPFQYKGIFYGRKFGYFGLS